MPDERTLHQHRCHCGVTWACGRVDCHYHDDCEACEQQNFERHAEHQGWTVSQPVLPELLKGNS